MLLLSSLDTFRQVIFLYNEVTKWASYTSYIATLLKVINNIKAGRFKKTLVLDKSSNKQLELIKGRGTIIKNEDIEFINV
jgi:ATP-binding cassette subfamily D (ALD) long-chain fatty acid import protein